MSGLVEKLEAAKVGSRELDALMHVEVANDPNTCVANSVFSFRDGWYCTGADMVCLADPVTTSLDAALALAERIVGEDEALWLLKGVAVDAEEDIVNGCIKLLPLRLCAALLKSRRALNLNETRHAE